MSQPHRMNISMSPLFLQKGVSLGCGWTYWEGEEKVVVNILQT